MSRQTVYDNRVVGSDVRRGADRLDPIVAPASRHRQRVIEIAGTIVQARQDVTVEVDH
jgi:hypothetical protein